MRLVYLDEAGVSNVAQEPVLVVAGVIVNPDRQWKELEAYFRDLAMALFPDDDPYRFVFHAKDIFHGSGPFDRSKWPRRERMRILAQLAQVPRLFDLPIAIGDIDRVATLKESQEKFPNAPLKSAHTLMHTGAFIQAVARVQFWMENNAPDENAMLIAEDTPELKSLFRNIHESYTDPTLASETAFRAPNVIDAVHFAQKSESLLLQIADHCAFIIKRKLMGKTDVDDCYRAIEPFIQMNSKPLASFAMRVHPSQIRPAHDSDGDDDLMSVAS